MSCYTTSKISTARKPHDCDRCDELIPAGARYLRYHLSRDFNYALHLSCAQVRSESGSLVYDCLALRTELKLPQRADFSSAAHSDPGAGEKTSSTVDPLDGERGVLPPFVCHTDGGASESYAQLAARVLVAHETY